MAEFTVNNITYKCRKFPAMVQLDLMLDFAPLLEVVSDIYERQVTGSAAAGSIASAISKMPREKTHSIIGSCMAACERKVPAGKGWASVWNEQSAMPMFDDIGLMEMGGIVMAVLQENFANFFVAPGSGSSAALPN